MLFCVELHTDALCEVLSLTRVEGLMLSCYSTFPPSGYNAEFVLKWTRLQTFVGSVLLLD